MLWGIVGVIVLAALVGMTRETKKTARTDDSVVEVTTYTKGDPEDLGTKAMVFVGIATISFCCPPWGIYLIYRRLADATKRGTAKVDVTQYGKR